MQSAAPTPLTTARDPGTLSSHPQHPTLWKRQKSIHPTDSVTPCCGPPPTLSQDNKGGGLDLRLDGLRDGSNLVDFEQEAVAGLLFNSSLDALGVCHRQVIAHYLNPHIGRELGPGLPVILVKGILNGDH